MKKQSGLKIVEDSETYYKLAAIYYLYATVKTKKPA